ncbi:putative disease resistance protein RGA3 [Zingiber officinale]|uniref:putative disease resistance protein RGA3 n=1 Tax=Zingiber officinale TaxID=94328 RepID=UPI001C4BDF81|nr:putative disease resistance protein RGA3 [Zingiber officinale]
MTPFMLKALVWFADNFLGSLVGKVADYAVQQFGVQHGLQDDIDKLQSSSEKSRLIIHQVEKLRIQDEGVKARLKELLMQLKDAAYDADDLLDEFQYQVLMKQVEQEENESTSFSLPSSSTALPATKKPRISVPTIADLISSSRDKDRVQKIKERIENITGDINQLIPLFPLSDLENQQQLISSTSRTTSSVLVETEVFGRDKYLNELKDLLLNASDGAGSSNISIPVLAIAGIGGIGKTTLAQQVYNDEAIQEHFQLKIWVCVSGNFSVERLTKEIIESATRKKCELTNLDALHVILNENITSKKFLLVLDDVWNEDSSKWEKFYAPLKNGAKGSKILVTTRSTTIAGMVGAVDPIHLYGLEAESFWAFFKKCVFGSQNNGDHPPDLETIAKTIAERLNGLPLAAKTVGGLLKVNMEKSHWETIMKSEIWQLPQNESDVLPVLQLSYQCLPAHLKRCFAFCSLFHKDYVFDKEELVRIWIAEGFVIPQGKERMEDVGSSYFEDLVSRSFFQKSTTRSYVMHDLIHDLAQLVSDGECYLLENGNTQEVSSLVRHLSVWPPASKPAYQLERKLLVLSGNNKWRSLIWKGNYYYNNWRSLIWNDNYYNNNNPTLKDLWRSLKYIRVLILQRSGIVELPEDVGELRHLRYLDLSFNYEMIRLPDSLCRLHNLQVLQLYECPIQSFPQGMSKLINLRYIDFRDMTLISKIYRIGRLTSLQQLNTFKVQNHPGHKLEELSGLTQLHGSLRISNLENVGSKEEANAGKLHNKVFIDSLTLEWMPNQDDSSEGNQLLILEELLKDLKWHPTLKELEISGYSWAAWDENYSWAKDIKLFPSVLQELHVFYCPKLKRLPPLPPSLVDLQLLQSGLTKLPNIWEEIDGSGHCKVATLKHLYIRCPYLTSLEDGLLSQNLPCLEYLILEDCKELMWLPMEKLKVFASLKEMRIWNCPKLLTMTHDLNDFLILPQSLKKLTLSNCGDLDKLLPRCLHNLTSLAHLEIGECPHLRSLPKEPLLHLKQLEYVKIHGCDELRSMEGLGVLKSLKNLIILECPNLLINGRDEHGKEEEEEEQGLLSLREICVDNTALLKIPPLRNALPSIHRLQIESSVEEVMFEGEEQELLRRLTVLRILMFSYCKELQYLPKELCTLPSLELLSISSCPEIESLPETGLPTSLTDLRCQCVNPMLKQQIQEKIKELTSSGRYRSVNERL